MGDTTKHTHNTEINSLKARITTLEKRLAIAEQNSLRAALPLEGDILTAIANLNAGLVIADATQSNFPILYVNRKFEEMTGYTAEEVIGRNCRFLQGGGTDVAAVSQIRKALSRQESFTVNLLNYRKDGSSFWNKLTLNPVFDNAGTLVRYIGLQSDITAQQQTVKALHESENKFRTLASMTSAGILIHQGGVFLYLNPAAEQITGYRIEELIHRDFWDIVHPDYQEMVRKRGMSRLQGDTPSPQYEIKIIHKDKQDRWVHLTNGLINYEGHPAVISTVFNVTERKQAEAVTRQAQDLIRRNAIELEQRVEERTAALAASEARLLSFLEASPDPIVIYDDLGAVTYVNPVFTAIFGWELDEIHGQQLNFVPPEHRQENASAIDKLLTTGRISGLETSRLTKDGRVLDVDISAGSFNNYDGSLAGTVIILRDATSRKQADREIQQYQTHLEDLVDERTAELNQSEHQSRALLSAIPDAMMRISRDGRYLDVHIPEGFTTPLTAEMMIGKTVYEIMPPDLAQSNMQHLYEALNTGEMQQFEYTRAYSHADQDIRQYEVRVTPAATNEVLAILRDVTKRKRAEAILHRRVEELAILNQMVQTLSNMTAWPDVLQIVVRMIGRLFEVKHTSVALLNDHRDTLTLQANFIRHAQPAEARQSEETLGTSIALADVALLQQVLGNKRPVTVQILPEPLPFKRFLWDPNTQTLVLVPLLVRGEAIGIIGIDMWDEEQSFNDESMALAETVAGQIAGATANAHLYRAAQREIEERTRTQEALALARDEALEASRFKSQLLAKVSHELRTPLGAILGFTELLQGGTFGSVTTAQQKIADEVIESTHYLTTMVNELLDQAKLETGSLTLADRLFTPQELVEMIRPQMQLLAQAKRLDISFILDKTLPAEIRGDQTRLQQIISNLVVNAIKFTRQGGITVTLEPAHIGHWAIKVADTGIGVPAEAQEYIFEPFRQVDGSITREYPGTGLGLSIVRQLTELMGGTISLESQLGQGSTFTVRLPLNLSNI